MGEANTKGFQNQVSKVFMEVTHRHIMFGQASDTYSIMKGESGCEKPVSKNKYQIFSSLILSIHGYVRNHSLIP